MRNCKFLLAGIFLTVFAAGCQEAPPPAPTPEEFERMVMEHYIGPFKVGDVATWMEVFDDDAVGLHNRMPAVVGKDAIRKFGTTVADTFRFREFIVSVDDIRISGDWALTRGSFTTMMVFKETREPAPWGREQGKFLLLWERQPDGVWKVIIDMGNTDLAEPAGNDGKSYEQQLSEDAAAS